MKKRISLLAATLLALVAAAPLPAHAVSCADNPELGMCFTLMPSGTIINNSIEKQNGIYRTTKPVSFHATPDSRLQIFGAGVGSTTREPQSIETHTAKHFGVTRTRSNASWTDYNPVDYMLETTWDEVDTSGEITITSPQQAHLYDKDADEGGNNYTHTLSMSVTGKPIHITLSNNQTIPISWNGNTGSATISMAGTTQGEEWNRDYRLPPLPELPTTDTVTVNLTSKPEVTLTGITIDGEILDTEEVAMGWTHIMAYANNPAIANVVVTFSDGTQVNATKSSDNSNGNSDYVVRYQGREHWVHVQPDQLTGISVDGSALQEFSDRETSYTVWSDRYYGHTITGTTLGGRTVQFEPKGNIYSQRVGGSDYTLTVNVPLEGIQIDGVSVPNFTSETHEYTVAVANPNKPNVTPIGTGPFRMDMSGSMLTVSSHGNAYTFHLTQATRLNTLPSTGGTGVVALAVLTVTLLIGGAFLALSNRHRK